MAWPLRAQFPFYSVLTRVWIQISRRHSLIYFISLDSLGLSLIPYFVLRWRPFLNLFLAIYNPLSGWHVKTKLPSLY